MPRYMPVNTRQDYRSIDNLMQYKNKLIDRSMKNFASVGKTIKTKDDNKFNAVRDENTRNIMHELSNTSDIDKLEAARSKYSAMDLPINMDKVDSAYNKAKTASISQALAQRDRDDRLVAQKNAFEKYYTGVDDLNRNAGINAQNKTNASIVSASNRNVGDQNLRASQERTYVDPITGQAIRGLNPQQYSEISGVNNYQNKLNTAISTLQNSGINVDKSKMGDKNYLAEILRKSDSITKADTDKKEQKKSLLSAIAKSNPEFAALASNYSADQVLELYSKMMADEGSGILSDSSFTNLYEALKGK